MSCAQWRHHFSSQFRRRIADALSHCVESMKRVLQSRGFVGLKEQGTRLGRWCVAGAASASATSRRPCFYASVVSSMRSTAHRTPTRVAFCSSLVYLACDACASSLCQSSRCHDYDWIRIELEHLQAAPRCAPRAATAIACTPPQTNKHRNRKEL